MTEQRIGERSLHCTCAEPWPFPIGSDTFCGTCGRSIRGRVHRAGLHVAPPDNATWAASHTESVSDAVNRDSRSLTARVAIAIGTAIAHGIGIGVDVARFLLGGRRR